MDRADQIPGVFISCVSSEFGSVRTTLQNAMLPFGWMPFIQEDLQELGQPTLEKIDDKIQRSRCVVHLVGSHPGTPANAPSLRWLRDTFDTLATEFDGALRPFLDDPAHTLTYTQWEVWLARLRRKDILLFEPASGADTAPAAGDPARSPAVSQAEHLEMLRAQKIYATPFSDLRDLQDHIKDALQASKSQRFELPRPIDFSGYIKRKLQDFCGRDWLMQRLDAWSERAQPPPFLLVAGFGFGKTAITARLQARWLARGDRDVVAHYCRYDDDATLRPDNIVQTIAAQFSALVPEYRAALQNGPGIQSALANAPTSAITALRAGLLAPLREIPRTRPCFLLIDALDESMELDQGARGQGKTLLDLIQLVAGNNELPTWVRVFMTSRKLDPVIASMNGMNFQTFDLEHDNLAQSRGDIHDYVRVRVEGSPAIGAFLQTSGIGLPALQAQLGGSPDAFFLLARSVLDDIDKGFYRPSTTFEAPQGLDTFYAQTFKHRVDRAHLDTALLNRVLGLVAVARKPLPAAVLAAATGTDEARINAIYQAFSGLLVHDAFGGITFAHHSLERWLSGTHAQLALAGHFRIERVQAERRLRQYAVAAVAAGLEQAGAAQRYLVTYGIELLIGSHEGDAACANEFAAAVSLLLALRDIRPRLLTAPAWQALLELVMDALQAQWQCIDDPRRADGRQARLDRLRAIDPQHLKALLAAKVYETGLYVPAVRVLIDGHGERGREVLGEVLADDQENDIVFRHDIGVAYSQAWHAATGSRRETLMQVIEQMAAPGSPDHDREIAGYAVKDIGFRFEPQGWNGPDQQRLQTLAVRYAHAATATDRMVGGEILMALAIHDVRVDAWVQDTPGTETPFWDPYWLNQRSDIDAIHTLLGLKTPNAAGDAEAARSFADAQAQYERAEALRAALQSCDFMRTNRTGRQLDLLILSFESQQDDALLFEPDALDDLIAALAGTPGREFEGPDAQAALNLIKLLMLHPLWNVLERATTLVAALIAREPRLMGLPAQLAAEGPTYWRLRYGAVDSAYNSGAADDYAGFFSALLTCGFDDDARVRGICSDDVNGWIRHADTEAVKARLRHPDFIRLMRYWVEHANDVWLLEYLHEIFHDLRFLHRLPHALLRTLMGPRSRYLASERFYEGPVDAFLDAIEQQRRDEWKAGLTGHP